LKQALRADSGLFRKALTVDLERGAVQKLVGVMDPDGAETRHV
jgi:hypothetical protein